MYVVAVLPKIVLSVMRSPPLLPMPPLISAVLPEIVLLEIETEPAKLKRAPESTPVLLERVLSFR